MTRTFKITSNRIDFKKPWTLVVMEDGKQVARIPCASEASAKRQQALWMA